MNREKLKEWFLSLDKPSKLEHIKKTSTRLISLHKAMTKASKAELYYGFNRVGVRGGKFTSLNAKASNCAKMYYDCEEEIKFITKLL